MSGVMPYLMEKGPYFSVLESKIASAAARAQLLGELRKPKTALSELVGFDSVTLIGDGLDPARRKEHLNEDWFGMVLDGRGGWTKQPGRFPTGFWTGYQGDTEHILRDAMACAIEVSFDLAPGDAIPAAPSRCWPIDIYWICQGPWFQCWVLWRRSNATNQGGHVTFVITT